jgi:hypothetical protein
VPDDPSRRPHRSVRCEERLEIDIRLIDDIDPDANPNLDFVLTDTMRLIEQLRNEVLPAARPNRDFRKAIERLAS